MKSVLLYGVILLGSLAFSLVKSENNIADLARKHQFTRQYVKLFAHLNLDDVYDMSLIPLIFRLSSLCGAISKSFFLMQRDMRVRNASQFSKLMSANENLTQMLRKAKSKSASTVSSVNPFKAFFESVRIYNGDQVQRGNYTATITLLNDINVGIIVDWDIIQSESYRNLVSLKQMAFFLDRLDCIQKGNILYYPAIQIRLRDRVNNQASGLNHAVLSKHSNDTMAISLSNLRQLMIYGNKEISTDQFFNSWYGHLVQLNQTCHNFGDELEAFILSAGKTIDSIENSLESNFSFIEENFQESVSKFLNIIDSITLNGISSVCNEATSKFVDFLVENQLVQSLQHLTTGRTLLMYAVLDGNITAFEALTQLWYRPEENRDAQEKNGDLEYFQDVLGLNQNDKHGKSALHHVADLFKSDDVIMRKAALHMTKQMISQGPIKVKLVEKNLAKHWLDVSKQLSGEKAQEFNFAIDFICARSRNLELKNCFQQQRLCPIQTNLPHFDSSNFKKMHPDVVSFLRRDPLHDVMHVKLHLAASQRAVHKVIIVHDVDESIENDDEDSLLQCEHVEPHFQINSKVDPPQYVSFVAGFEADHKALKRTAAYFFTSALTVGAKAKAGHPVLIDGPLLLEFMAASDLQYKIKAVTMHQNLSKMGNDHAWCLSEPSLIKNIQIQEQMVVDHIGKKLHVYLNKKDFQFVDSSIWDNAESIYLCILWQHDIDLHENRVSFIKLK